MKLKLGLFKVLLWLILDCVFAALMLDELLVHFFPDFIFIRAHLLILCMDLPNLHCGGNSVHATTRFRTSFNIVSQGIWVGLQWNS